MRFIRFGITLQRLEPDDLEMVRVWRNGPRVRPYMRYHELIQPEEQKQWFQSLDAERDWYFIARTGDIPFAVFDIKDIDWSAEYGEAGGFVGDSRYIGRPEPGQATLALMDFGFHLLGLKSLKARYSASLDRIVRLNDRLGYVITHQGADGFLYAQVTADRYLRWAAPLRKAAVTAHGSAALLISPTPWLMSRIQPPPTATQPPDWQLAVR